MKKTNYYNNLIKIKLRIKLDNKMKFNNKKKSLTNKIKNNKIKITIK
jgi:hypothetical protein